MEIMFNSQHFDPVSGRGPQTARLDFHFPREVDQAIAVLTGYTLGYNQSGGDHFVGLLSCLLDTHIDGDLVSVDVTLGVRDWSGEWDDKYDGQVDVAVLAELAPISTPPPRPDVWITGMEQTQATQFFRSGQHLDFDNIRPDNSIPLVAGKTTGLRIYVNYDPVTGLSPISMLTGEVVVTSTARAETTHLLPNSPIVPRLDADIQRSQVGDTLNFAIPAEWCRDELLVQCTVFDAAAPDQRSRVFERVLDFVEVADPHLWTVGVVFHANGANLDAPTSEEIASALSFAEKVFPIAHFDLRGYSTLTLDTFDTTAVMATECNQGFHDLLDRLRDLRGSSTDIYLAMFPTSLDMSLLGMDIGCGTDRGSVAASIAVPAAVAHELGHTLEQMHPTDDSQYPHYGMHLEASIGEFGYDPATNTVFNPDLTLDFMNFQLVDSEWVSPYRYHQLNYWLNRSFETGGVFPRDGMIIHPRLTSILFLGLEIARDRTVQRRPSFHYPAWPLSNGLQKGTFAVELLDASGRTLYCHQLSGSPETRTQGWPQSFREMVLYPAGARHLIVWEDRQKLYEEAIPDPAVIKQFQADYLPEQQSFQLSWEATSPDGVERELWYLVHWQDDDGTWRGLAPRSKDPVASVPLELFRRRKELPVRVLVTSGIATGMAASTLHFPTQLQQGAGRVDIQPTGPWANPRVTPDSHAGPLTVIVLDQWGRSVPETDIQWYNQQGQLLGRGRALSTQSLPSGKQILRVVASTPLGTARYDWQVALPEEAASAPANRKSRQIQPGEKQNHANLPPG